MIPEKFNLILEQMIEIVNDPKTPHFLGGFEGFSQSSL